MTGSGQSSPTPRVSIGMAIYNGQEYVREALDSLLGQSFGDFELIISDNASTDATEAICRAYSARDRRIRFVRQRENIGAIANFRFVLNESRGEYFLWASHDDVRDLSSLRKLVELLDHNPGAILASSRFDFIDRIGKPKKCKTDWQRVFSGAKRIQLLRFILAGTQKAVHVYGLYRADLLRNRAELESFTDEQPGWDIALLFNLLIAADFVIGEEVLFHFRYGHHQRKKMSWEAPVVLRNARRLLLSIRSTHLSMRTYVPRAPKTLRPLLYVFLPISETLCDARLCIWICAHRLEVVSKVLGRNVKRLITLTPPTNS